MRLLGGGTKGSARVMIFLCGLVLDPGLTVVRANELTEATATGDIDRPLFEKGDTHLTISAGAGIGMENFLTSVEAHDWALATLEYGRVISQTLGEGRWYQGNWELLGQLFGGGQWSPSSGYIVGVAPVIRYNFTSLHGVVPFVDLAAGVSLTDIRDGSLSTTFEFNVQAGAGAHIFLKRDLALTLQYRLYHISNAGMDVPNAGINTSTFLAGVSWFF